ncbi:MAG: radical SAM protein [Alphaproteobacteria bacterium]|nr:radical SAM protein [Alphaproteobacteria bacterium]
MLKLPTLDGLKIKKAKHALQPGETGIDLHALTTAPFQAKTKRAPNFAPGAITTNEVCNLSCVMCHFNGPNAVKKGKLLKPELVRKAMDEYPAGSHIYLASTGEFFLDPNSLDHLRYAISRGLKPQVLSHGQFYTPKLIDELLAIGLRSFRISCDAIDASHYERIRRGGKFQVILDALAYINTRRAEFPDLDIEIGCTLFKTNFHLQPEYEAFWREHGVDKVHFNAEYFDTFRYRNLLATPKKRVDCAIQTYVLPSGKVAPCCAMIVYAHDHDVSWLPDLETHTLKESYDKLCDMYDDPKSELSKLCAKCDWWIMFDQDPAGNSPYFRTAILKKR